MTVPLSMLIVHFIADFLLQTDWMALNKSKQKDALLAHVTVYSIPFLYWGWEFAAMTFFLHLVTDGVTSQITSRLFFFVKLDGVWEKVDADNPWIVMDPWVPVEGKRHWFFVAIGADQLIHACCLAWTSQLLFG